MRLLKSISRAFKTNIFFSFLAKNIAYGVLRTLFATYRLRVVYAPGVKQPLTKQEGIFYFWHQQIIPGMFFFHALKGQGSCIVSPSNDGKFAGFICSKLGFNVLYGSSFKQPITLIRQALSELKGMRRLCMVGDGSRGPAFALQPGLTYFAGKMGIPLIFIECKQQWSYTLTKSWDQFKIPLPFSIIQVTVHTPQHVVPTEQSPVGVEERT